MKTPVLCCCAALLALCPAVFAAAVVAKSNITAVTVYTDRAVVTRTAPVEVAAHGPLEIAFERLPAALVNQSLTVAGRGTAQLTILDVTARDVHVDFTPNERVKALEDQLRELGKQRRQLDDRGTVSKAQEASLTRVEAAATAAPVKDSAPRLSIEESVRLLAFLEEQRGKLTAERQSLDAQLEALSARETAAQKQLAELRGSGGRSFKTVTVRLEATTAGQVELAVSYALPGASWTPSYDARANSNDPTVELSYFGQVRQNTGEDWKDIALTLSTAQPSLGGAAPEAGTWVVDVSRPRYAPAMATTAVANAPVMVQSFTVTGSAGSRGWSAPARSAPAPVEYAVAAAETAVETTATSASFKVAVAATVPSDNSPQKIPVTTVKLGAIPEYSTTPKRLAAAFLNAKVTNTSEFPLLPGALNVFLDGTFVATSSLRSVMPGEKFDLSLGADEGITVKHKRVQRFAEDTGLTNRGRRITYEYVVTIQNNKKAPAHIVVADHVPLSRYERIVVKVLSPSEKEQKPAADGAVKWTLDLKPGEKRELPLKFSIEYPNELQIAGLEA